MTESTALVTTLNAAKSLDKVKNALPVSMQTDEFARSCVQVALVAVNKTPALTKCSQTSILQSVVEAAQYGLQIDGVLGHAYLVPYNTKVENAWVNQAQMQVGYKGLLYLARKGDPDIDDIECNIVYEKDLERPGRFDIELGDNPRIHHTPNWNPGADGRGEPIMVYSIVTKANGTKSRHWMPIADVYAIRDKSAKNLDKPNSPWNKHREAMIKKTCLRQHCKLLNLSKEDTRYQRAIDQDEMRDMGVMQGSEYVKRTVKSVGGDADLDELNESLQQGLGTDPSEAPQSDDQGEQDQTPSKPKKKAPAKRKAGKKDTQPDGDDDKMTCPSCERTLGPSAFDSPDGICMQCEMSSQEGEDEGQLPLD